MIISTPSFAGSSALHQTFPPFWLARLCVPLLNIYNVMNTQSVCIHFNRELGSFGRPGHEAS